MDLRSLAKHQFTETDRVMSLPLVPSVGPEAFEFCEQFKRPGCTWDFKVPQASTLYSIHKFGGAIVLMGVGTGKTLVSYLAPRAAGARKVVLLLRPADVPTYHAEVAKYEKQFDPGDASVHIIPYSKLSDPRFSSILEEIEPDMIIGDEAQTLMNKSARAGRFWRYCKAHPDTTLVMMSATLISGSIAGAALLSEYSLGVKSPLPHSGHHLEVWQRVLDPKERPSRDEVAWFEGKVTIPMKVDIHSHSQIEAARIAAGRRFVQSEGVIFTPSSSTDVPLTIKRIHVPVPEEIDSAIHHVKTEMVTPNGEEVLTNDALVVTVQRMLACGFYNRWAWEEVGGRDQDWLNRRGTWNRALAAEIRSFSRPAYDSEKLISDYILAECELQPELVNKTIKHNARWRWAEVEHKPAPPSVPVWVDTFLIDEVLRRYADKEVILWYSHKAVEQELTRRGIECYGSGTFLDGPRRLVGASIAVHGTGRNLQAWDHAVVIEPPADGLVWEQLLGRLHRQGQTNPVQFDVFWTHDCMRKAIDNAVESSKFIQSMQMTPQRLLSATWTH